MGWFYKEYGFIGLLPLRKQSYSVSFKLKVLKATYNDLLSLRTRSSNLRYQLLQLLLNGREILLISA